MLPLATRSLQSAAGNADGIQSLIITVIPHRKPTQGPTTSGATPQATTPQPTTPLTTPFNTSTVAPPAEAAGTPAPTPGAQLATNATTSASPHPNTTTPSTSPPLPSTLQSTPATTATPLPTYVSIAPEGSAGAEATPPLPYPVAIAPRSAPPSRPVAEGKQGALVCGAAVVLLLVLILYGEHRRRRRERNVRSLTAVSWTRDSSPAHQPLPLANWANSRSTSFGATPGYEVFDGTRGSAPKPTSFAPLSRARLNELQDEVNTEMRSNGWYQASLAMERPPPAPVLESSYGSSVEASLHSEISPSFHGSSDRGPSYLTTTSWDSMDE
ncbi:hypothetical protein ACHHYP_14266 [Achlya hypogyna]|uniref:Uncharacterized protein n=1 Tax=Achlya hypogyna TaxID=1202772 RepID=A0A1V9YDL3_ACHHY|nr:hypothetical protein ACHHYP_14266 [Achlya hypogyna]